MAPTLRTFVLALMLGAVLAPAAQASPGQISIMMDDDLLVYRDDNTAARTLTQMKSLGVDAVRVTVLWRVAAENANLTKDEIADLKGGAKTRARRQAKRFRGANPATYPTRNWDRYDNLVKKANELGIQVYFNVTGPGPRFAHATAPKSQRRNQGTWKPKAGLFKQFVTAVGRRYDGTYKDENASRGTLPRVTFWSLWNEPNQAGWLSPQWEQHGSTKVPTSPALFRTLYQFGYKGLVASGHGGDTILLGETAPKGSSRRSARAAMRPGKFLRELACVDDKGAKYTGRAASLRDCGDFAKRGSLKATGYAHHPYTKNVPPTVRDKNPDDLTMANISELGTMLDDLSAKTGGNLPTGLPLLMTEFGFETDPPDKFSGVSLDKQAEYNQLGEFMAWQNPRILSQAQFILRDVAPVRKFKRNSKPYFSTYQSGIFFQRGQPKPSAYAYALPFVIFPSAPDPATGAQGVGFWGQLRFLRNGTPASATIQFKPTGQPAWLTVGGPVAADTRGFFTGTTTAPVAGPGEWRAVWLLPDGQVGQYSLGRSL